MLLYEESEFKKSRVTPHEFWHGIIANFLAESLGDIYKDEEKLYSCYSPKRSNPYDENEYPKTIFDYIMNFRLDRIDFTPFIIFGTPGIGKTTYLSNLFKVCLPTKYNCKIYPIFFDLRNSDLNNLYEKFVENIELTFGKYFFESFLKGKSAEERLIIHIEMFKEKIANQLVDFDPDNYRPLLNNPLQLEKIKNIIEKRYLMTPRLTWIKKIDYASKMHNLNIVFIIDNFDHRRGKEDLHEHVYDLSKTVLFDFRKPVFLPMRNYTYFDSYDRYGYLEADKARNKVLSAPIHKDLFMRRKEYILSKIPDKIKLALESGAKFIISPEDIKNQLELVMSGIEGNNDILNFLENISGENIRVFLDLIINAIQSGHLEYSKEIDGRIRMPYKAFIKACSFCNNKLYTPTERRTPVINIFDNMEALSAYNILIRVRLLQLLRHASSPVTFKNIARELDALGYTEESLRKAAKALREAGLVDEYPYFKAPIKNVLNKQQLINTTIGKYYLEKLVNDPNYFELMCTSCNLPYNLRDDAIIIATKGTLTTEQRSERYKSLLKIIDFIENCEKEERKHAKQDKIDINKYFKISDSIRNNVNYLYRLK